MINGYHTPVLSDEVLSYLRLHHDGIYVDGTLGGGGHAEQIVRELSPQGRLVGFDRDSGAIRFAMRRLKDSLDRMIFVQDNFSHMKPRLADLGILRVDGVVMDLGVSSFQIDESSRGFSFQQESRLDMRMDQSQQFDARTVVNSYDQEKLAEIFWKFGEERNSRKIARAIVEERKRKPIDTTWDLRTTIERVAGGRFLQKTLARIFQAVRIEVNRELESLDEALRCMPDILLPGGRLVVVAYHSLEDRIVKNFFKEESRTSLPSGSKYLPDQARNPRLQILTKKPVMARADEIASNPRARSAKLRAAERV